MKELSVDRPRKAKDEKSSTSERLQMAVDTESCEIYGQ